MERITSRTNPLITHIRKLNSSAAYRRECREFLCDSPKLLTEALLWNGGLKTVIYIEGSVLPDIPEDVRVVCVPSDVMSSISPVQTPQGILSICTMPVCALPEKLNGQCYLILDGVQDPGNVGTILRTADAFSVDGIFLLTGCAGLYHPKTVRASMGAIFRCPAWTCNIEELDQLIRASNIFVWGATIQGDTQDIRNIDLHNTVAAIIGSEGRGLSQEALALCDGTFHIPMCENCESLNAATAAGIFLWESAKKQNKSIQ